MAIASHGSTKKAEDIIGRGQEMTHYWKILEKQSLLLSSVRRIGKTCILRKMCDQPADGWVGVEYFVQGKISPEEFTYDLYKLLKSQGILKHTKWKSISDWGQKNLGDKDFGSFKIPSFKGKWKDLLTDIVRKVAESDLKLVIMIDELPLMLWELMNKGKEQAESAMELLDILRTLRVAHEANSNLRFIFCGSIGMGIVLQKFKNEYKYMGQPTNNMKIETVVEMSEPDSVELCKYFLEDYPHDLEHDLLISKIQEITDRIPYYIEMAFDFFQKKGIDRPAPEDVVSAFNEALNDPNESHQFSHFSERIEVYYEETEIVLADHILNYLCRTKEPINETLIINAVKTQTSDSNEKQVKDVLTKLWKDLCIDREIRDEGRHYKFKFNLIRKWWKINKA
ncbi:hypothetical protein BFP97_15195 [Roseivirga sp. 4D4]|uniref:hypothetical protein n=1 Tax=Roseivirga sp. 4D4 TaxID=1889784 RepID=UPI000852E4CD|nr:hypothetical protein [Roseivirga sp. 4D4]OEK02787.1 hypothetical protein BFP97_15195 [Roseivirga sp. 4D4]